MFKQVDRCRICGNPHLVTILSLGDQHLTGVFPRQHDAPITKGPLELVKCDGPAGQDQCGLVQLRHEYEPTEMYGANYGYRSSLNRSMVNHLAGIVSRLTELVTLATDDVVLDIGSNDGTLLGFYPEDGPALVGIDPTAAKFASYYKPHIKVIPDFFTADLFRQHFGERRATIVTSIAMFYDLPRPADFMAQVRDVLADDGVWLFEQSYMPAMLEADAYDTVCHEHVEYYGLGQIKYMADRVGLKIVDIRLNDVNGGSFAVTVARQESVIPECKDVIAHVLGRESNELHIDTVEPFAAFARRVSEHRDRLCQLLADLRNDGKTVVGYGASTKGNVILQYCGITKDELPCIAEVNEDKFGCFTPGTRIPIVSEADAKAMNPDYLLVLPWHFRRNLIEREQAWLKAGGRMIFPLPHIETVQA